MGQFWVVGSMREAELFNAYVREEAQEGRRRTYAIEEYQRTGAQNRGIHGFCGRLGKLYDANDIHARAVVDVISNRVEIPWSGEVVKNVIWRPIQIAITGEKSTTKITVEQVGQIAASVQRMSAEHFDINVPFGIDEMRAA